MHRQLWLALWTGILCSRTTVTCFNMHSCLSTCRPRKMPARRGNPRAREWWVRTSSLRLLAAASENSSLLELQRLEQDIVRYNHGRPLNVNSPKQISMAVFGTVRSTTVEVLTQASKGEGVQHERQQTLANLILQHRALTKRAKQRQQSTAFSTLASDDKIDGHVIQEEQDGVHDIVEDDEDTSTVWQKTTSASMAASYGQSVEALSCKKSKIDSYWKEPLLLVTKPSARNMVVQLNPTLCPMGYDPSAAPIGSLKTTTEPTAGKKGSLLAYVRENKERFPDCIILTRVGDFYETYGIDAILLVEHCGLNAMAGKARAGCPIRNVQATLDCLTSNGFRVAVYEEAADTDAASGAGATAGPKSRLKNRMLAQIVSSASPTYLYDLVLAGNADALITSPASRPYVGILESAAGYSVVEVSTEERSVRISERLTAEAVSCRLAAYPPADPLIYVPSTRQKITALPFLPSRSDSASDGPGSRLRLKVLPPTWVEEPAHGVSDVERARRTIVGALLQLMERGEDDNFVKVDDFVLVASSSTTPINASIGTQTNPLYVETATQLGLMNDKTIPPLVSYLLPESAPAATRRFLRRWLLTPPPPAVAGAMSSLVTFLKDRGPALPPLSVPPIGKVLALIRAGQASAQVYGELLAAMDATVAVLDTLNSDNATDDMISPLMILLEYESGIAADRDSLRSRCVAAMEVIQGVISPIHHVRNTHDGSDQISDYGDLIPRAFFERNEAPWRGRVQSTAAEESYERVRETVAKLAQAVAIDFWGMNDGVSTVEVMQDVKRMKSPIVQDIFNNIFAIKEIPSCVNLSDENAKSIYFHPRDRNGKLLRNRYTSTNVQSALADYVAACERACLEVTSVLTRLSKMLCESGHLPAVVQAAHLNLILSTAFHHAANANALGWNAAITYEAESDTAGHLLDVWPYWMDHSEAVSNSFDMVGLFLLTAPNMSGKSTLMRSTAAAALLSNCGLCAPLGPGSTVQRFDNIFVRGASADVPTEDKSAFGAEMGDIAALLRSCGGKSLVLVDELGRGTSPKDGTCLAGAVLEAMAGAGMSGVFATHLHDVLDLPLNGQDRIVMKRMAFEERRNGDAGPDYVWTYKLEDGYCTNSLALVTAARFGLPDEILQRAKLFASLVQSSSMSKDLEISESLPDSAQRNGENHGVENSLHHAIRFAEDIIGQQGIAIRIPPQWSVPPALEGRSCVYILELGSDKTATYYVGETDSLHRRLGQHRSKGGAWVHLTAAALPISGGKTQARNVESLVIRKLAKAGFLLESLSDGRSVRSTGRQ